MGDGKVALILDVLGVGQRSGVLTNHEASTHSGTQAATAAKSENQRILLFRAGSFTRLAIPLSLVARLEEFPRAQVECAGGHHVVQYRDGILTLVSLASVLEPQSHTDAAVMNDPVQAIVVTDGQRNLGIIVDQILDIVDEVVTVRQTTKRGGLLGSAVVGKQVTDFLDLRAVVQSAAPEWLEQDTCRHDAVVMVAEPSLFLRGLIRGELEMAGHAVVEAGDTLEALSRLEERRVGLVIAARTLPPEGFEGLREAMRHQPNLAGIPVMELSVSSSDRESMLASIGRLAAAVTATESDIVLEQLEKAK